MQVINGEKLLEKYDLKVDDAILAEEKHLAMYVSFLSFLNPKLISCNSSYGELVNEYRVTFLAGGAAQNAARGAAVSRRQRYHLGMSFELFWLYSMFFLLNPFCLLGLSATMKWLSNSSNATDVRV